MTDIIEQLRDKARELESSQHAYGEAVLYLRAADEIERLSAGLIKTERDLTWALAVLDLQQRLLGLEVRRRLRAIDTIEGGLKVARAALARKP